MSVVAVVGSLVVFVGPDGAGGAPVASEEALYERAGRVFPDPHGCVRGAPQKSPWAKGNLCALQFAQWDETLAGLRFLEERFPRYLQVINLREQFGDHPAFRGEELQSAGLPREDLSRDKRDLYVIKVTDRQSPRPEPERRHFAYSLSIHGIERAGLEGGVRAIEDLVTWAACEEDADAAPACATEGPFPKPILEPSNSGPTAGRVLDEAVVYFVFANPDGWHRGEVTKGGVFFQRYNGNGMDGNRDWPTVGYTEEQYTPASEPETRGYGAFLRWVRDRTAAGRFAGAIDLHGMVTARSFSFTLLGAGQRDYRKNALTVNTSITTFRDSEARLAWSPLIADRDNCPGTHYTIPAVSEGNHPMCSDQWGTVWDTIDYQVSGSFGDWMDSPLGLDAIGIDNEMALSHLLPNTHYDADLEQLHIDGNKGLIYAQIATLLDESDVQFVPGGRTAYVFDPERTTHPGGGPAGGGASDLPTQPDIETTQVNGIQELAFEVKGPADGFRNGGLSIEATYGNVRGVSSNAAADLALEYCGPPDHPGDDEGCREVAHYFNQSPLYLQGGARIDLNDPRPGPYRVTPNAARGLPTRFHVSFSSGPAYPQPEQAPYDVSRMDFFDDLNEYAAPGTELTPLTVGEILADPAVLRTFDSVVVANDFMPGFVPAGEPPEPAGDPQPPGTFAFGPEAAPVPTADATPLLPEPNGTHEFDVEDGFDNDRLVVRGTWATPSDFDMRLEQQNPATGSWEPRGCQCSFVANGEQVTVFQPSPGRWRVRLENYAAAPQAVTGSTRFFTDPAPPAAPPSAWTDAQYGAYAGALAEYAATGGNLVLTDAALGGLPSLGTGVAPEAVVGGVFYAGWMDFEDGQGPTYDRHHLARDVDKEGTAEGQGEVDGQEFVHRHQTYEPVPLGYVVGPGGSGNSACDTERCDSPNWIVAQDAWTGAGGTTAARTLVRETSTAGDDSHTGTSLGELPYGLGVIRVAGAVLPDPTEENFHPYGLSSYALTYTGYQVFENLVAWDNPGRIPEVLRAVDLSCDSCALDVRAGDQGTARLEVTNTGTVADTDDLAVASAPDGWAASVDRSTVSTGSAETAVATLSVTPPVSAKKGTYDVVVRATSQTDPSVTDEVTIRVTAGKGAPGSAGAGGHAANGQRISAVRPATDTGTALGVAVVAAAAALASGRARRSRRGRLRHT